MTTKKPILAKGRVDRGTTSFDRTGTLCNPLTANSSKAIGVPDNVGLTAQTTR
ncbi:MAG: hypothetical protein ACK2TV_15670 [Anaerolineales bacterium]